MSENAPAYAAGVEIKFDSIRWNVIATPVVIPEDGVAIELAWGWTAGMTPEEIERLSDDCPKGHESVLTMLDHAELLRDRLTEIIDQYKSKHEELRVERKKKWDEILRKLCELDKSNEQLQEKKSE